MVQGSREESLFFFSMTIAQVAPPSREEQELGLIEASIFR